MDETKQKPRILVVDDLRTNALALASALAEEWDPQIALDGQTALEMAAQTPPPDIILLDVSMPNMDGYEVCRLLKASEQTRDIPVMFVTAKNDLDDEARGLELGAVDYVIKPVSTPIVRARIRNHLALQKVKAQLVLKNKALEQLATRDELTGLYNRRRLKEKLAQEVLRADRYDRPLSVIMIDVDHFKAINDTHGHPVGDTVLVETSSRMQASLRNIDVPGRWGGEEFLIVCPETDIHTASLIAERLRRDYERLPFKGAGPVTASFGVASYRKGRADSEIIQAADQALYRAKNNGRNRVEKEGVVSGER